MADHSTQPAIQVLLRRLSGPEQLNPSRQRLWINRYRLGDQVPAHRDVERDRQLLVCLEAQLEPQLGGDLWIEGHRVSLRAGDTVLFAASQRRHGTSRIDSRRVRPSGVSRLTLVLQWLRSTNPYSYHIRSHKQQASEIM